LKYIVVILFAMISINTLQAQEDIEIIEITDDSIPKDLPFAIIENVPVYPGCTGEDNALLKKCMSDNIAAFVGTHFNIKKASKGLASGKHNVFVNFKIDKEGFVTNIKSRGPNRKLEKEAIRVMKKLPRLQPGKQKGKNVGVLYSLPITFYIEDDTKKG